MSQHPAAKRALALLLSIFILLSLFPAVALAEDGDSFVHIAAEPVRENVVPPACLEAGSYDEAVYCEDCGEELSRTLITVPAAGHIEDDPVTENAVAATDEADGSHDEVVYCTVCGEELSRKTVTDLWQGTIPAEEKDAEEEEKDAEEEEEDTEEEEEEEIPEEDPGEGEPEGEDPEENLSDELLPEEEESEELEESVAFEDSETVGDIVITVKAEAGVFPQGATLWVEQVPVYQEVEEALDLERDEEKKIAVSYTFDIRALDADGNELQPAEGQTVSVSFAMAEVADENLETNVYHVTEDEYTGELTAETLDVTQELTPETEEESTAVVETEGFSLYTVEFTYNTLQFVLEGDFSAPVSEILDAVGLSGMAEFVEVSAPNLFSVSNETGEWVVTSHLPFSSEEWMNVTINGIVYEITVMDDQTITSWRALRNIILDPNAFRVIEVTLTQNVTGGDSDSPIVIPQGKTVILDLDGYTLDRGLSNAAARADGHAFVVERWSTLTIKDSSEDHTGTITGCNKLGSGGCLVVEDEGELEIQGGNICGNKASGDGGAIYSFQKVVITGGTISGNTAENGAGICLADSPSAYLNLYGGTITGNTASKKGGGILLSAQAEIYTKGSPVVRENPAQYGGNIYLSANKVLNVTGAFEGANLWIHAETTPTTAASVTVTSGYLDRNPNGLAGSFIHADEGKETELTSAGEVAIRNTLSEVWYLYREWNESTATITEERRKCESYTVVANGSHDREFRNGWYVFDGTVGFNERISIDGSDVNFILMDGCNLKANYGISVPSDSHLKIWGEPNETGTLNATGDNTSLDFISMGSGGSAGIGGEKNRQAGTITINSGTVIAKGSSGGAGIGGGDSDSSGFDSITINGGNVKAEGGFSNGAGIGSGRQNPDRSCGSININGGTVTAIGGGSQGAGIGGGEDQTGASSITINGGTVTAKGTKQGAGIGGGSGGIAPDIVINGGTIDATGGERSAAIGGGYRKGIKTITITGGNINAHCPKSSIHTIYAGAGIGAGSARGHQGGTITISGGEVTAVGQYGAGIGGGGRNGGNGGEVKIFGGQVNATSQYGAGIGGGGSTDGTNSNAGKGGTVTVTGGKVTAMSGVGAGIGGGGQEHDGKGGDGGTFTISGGEVFAHSLQGGAGIGGGNRGDGGSVTVNGGYLLATSGQIKEDWVKNVSNGSSSDANTGFAIALARFLLSELISGIFDTTEKLSGAGIGGGVRGSGGSFVWNGGTVIAKAEVNDASAIGKGKNGNSRGTVKLNFWPKVSLIKETDSSIEYEPRDCQFREEALQKKPAVMIEPCGHNVSSWYGLNDKTHHGTCTWCSCTFDEEHTYNADHVCVKCDWHFRNEGEGYLIWFYPGSQGTGSMPNVRAPRGTSYTLPNCEFTPNNGYAFDGWNVETRTPGGGHDDTYFRKMKPGEKFDVKIDGTSVIAQWKQVQVEPSAWQNLSQLMKSGLYNEDSLYANQNITAESNDSFLQNTIYKRFDLFLNGLMLDGNALNNGHHYSILVDKDNNNIAYDLSISDGVVRGNSDLIGILVRESTLDLVSVTVTGCATGVRVDGGTFRVGGNVNISENGSETKKSNVFLAEGERIHFSGVLTDESRIGVTVATTPTDDNPVVITKDLWGDRGLDRNGNVRSFFSDDPNYLVGLNEDGEAILGTKKNVSFDANGGSGSMEYVDVACGSIWTLPKCSFTAPANKVFAGWTIRNGEDVQPVTNSLKITGNTTLYASWEPRNTYHLVTYLYGDEEESGIYMIQRVEAGQKAVEPDEPERPSSAETYVFSGWMKDEVSYNFDTVVTEDITLVAAWSVRQPTVTIYAYTTDKNCTTVVGSVDVRPDVIVTAGTEVTLTATVPEGYVLDGWYPVTSVSEEGLVKQYGQKIVTATAETYTFTTSADDPAVLIAAVYAANPDQTYKVEVSNSIQNGTVSIQNGDGPFHVGDSINLEISPSSGSRLTELWYEVEVPVSSGNAGAESQGDSAPQDTARMDFIQILPDEEGKYSFLMPAQDVKVFAEFEKRMLLSVYTSDNEFQDTVSNCRIVPDPGQNPSYWDADALVTVTVGERDEYTFLGWYPVKSVSEDGKVTDYDDENQLADRLRYSFRITDDTSIVAIFRKNEDAVVIAPIAKENLVYNGTAQNLIFGGSADGGTMLYALGTEKAPTEGYSREVPSAANAGTYYVWYRIIGNRGKEEINAVDKVTVRISKANIANTTLALAQDLYFYDGTAKTPAVTLKDGSMTLVKDSDYTVSYTGNTQAGKATVTVTGIGNYSGTQKKYFYIVDDSAISTEVTVKSGAPETESSNIQSVARSLFNDEELKVLATGGKAKVWLEISPLTEVPAKDKSVLEAKAKELGAKIGAWFDISLYRQIGTGDAEILHETPEGNAMQLSVEVPKSMQNKVSEITRTFYLIRYHEGTAKVIAETTGTTLTGQSDLFSSHAIAYKDNITDSNSSSTTGKKSTSPHTGDESRTGLWIALACIGAAGLLGTGWALARRRRKKK